MDMGEFGKVDVETDYSASINRKEFFDPKAKNMYDKTVKTGPEFFKAQKEQILNTINRKKKEMVPPTHSNYKLLKKSLNDQEDALEAIKVTEDLGGNENMFDFLRTQNIADYKAKPLQRSNYTKTDAEIKAEIEAGNKKGIESLKNKKDDPEGFYTGGMVDVEPNLSDIGHGSDALMARTRLVSPDGQATTSTGLNYLLAEDNDNIRVPFSKGKAATKGLSYLMDLFKPKPKVIFDEKRFREGPVTTEFLENINKKDLEPFIRSRDTMGPGGYGMYDDFADMPSGLQAAELISRIKGPRNTINYEAAEMFIGKKLKGNESVNELIEMLVEKKAEGGRIGFSKGKLADAARRKFMKTAGAAGAGIAALKTGLIGLGEKAAPVVEKTVEYTAPALNKIVETVMSVGDLMSQSGRRLKELTTKKKFKDIEVEEDMIDGPSYTIKKDGETIYYRPGKQDESGGFEDDIIEVIDETITKKASGGIARMIGE